MLSRGFRRQPGEFSELGELDSHVIVPLQFGDEGETALLVELGCTGGTDGGTALVAERPIHLPLAIHFTPLSHEDDCLAVGAGADVVLLQLSARAAIVVFEVPGVPSVGSSEVGHGTFQPLTKIRLPIGTVTVPPVAARSMPEPDLELKFGPVRVLAPMGPVLKLVP